MAAQRCDKIDRFRPLFWATFRPGLSTVPLAERVMLPMAVSSTAINNVQVLSAWFLVPAETPFGFAVASFDVHPAGTSVT